MKTIDSFKNENVFNFLKEKILDSGSDNLDYFGGKFQGGYKLQQNVDEFASLCAFLRTFPTFKHYCEIGSASGGNLRFMNENVGFLHVTSLDNSQHPEAVDQPKNYFGFSNRLKYFTGDSHSQEAENFLKERCLDVGRIDVAFIDGDHSCDGVLLDSELCFKYSHRDTLYIFHDTIACQKGGVGEAYERMVHSNKLETLAHFIGEEKPMGIAVCKRC